MKTLKLEHFSAKEVNDNQVERRLRDSLLNTSQSNCSKSETKRKSRNKEKSDWNLTRNNGSQRQWNDIFKVQKGGHISGIQLVVSPKTKHNLPHDPVIPLPVIYPGKM